MSHVTRMDESCHTYGRVMSHVWMIRVTRMHVTRMPNAHLSVIFFDSCDYTRSSIYDAFESPTLQ